MPRKKSKPAESVEDAAELEGRAEVEAAAELEGHAEAEDAAEPEGHVQAEDAAELEGAAELEDAAEPAADAEADAEADAAGDAEAEEPAEPEPPKPVEKAPLKTHTVRLAMPIAAPVEGYQHRHIDLQLKEREVNALAHLRSGLIQKRMTLLDDRPIWTGADVVRWLLQELGSITSNRDWTKED